MNVLEKLNILLAKDSRIIKYGSIGNEIADPVICLTIGESMPISAQLGKGKTIENPTVDVSVIGTNYLASFDLSEAIKTEIMVSESSIIKFVYLKTLASEQKDNKYIFKSQFKQIF